METCDSHDTPQIFSKFYFTNQIFLVQGFAVSHTPYVMFNEELPFLWIQHSSEACTYSQSECVLRYPVLV